MLDPIDPEIIRLAAERSGLDEADVGKALLAFRHITSNLHEEPDWQLSSHFSFRDYGVAVYRAEGTAVTLQVETPRIASGGWGKAAMIYIYGERPYETFGEARAAELRAGIHGLQGKE